MDYIEIISAAVGGGFLTKLFDYLMNLRKAESDDFDTIVAQWQQDNERLRQENKDHKDRQDELYKKIAEHEKKLSALNAKLLVMESSYMHIPLPSWLKDIDGTMLAVNDAYEMYFLIPNGFVKSDYIGKTDSDVWPENVAQEFIGNDILTLQSEKKIWFGKETILIKDVDVSDNWRVLKYVRYAGNIAVGIAGIAIPSE
jgi:hypothetical protein